MAENLLYIVVFYCYLIPLRDNYILAVYVKAPYNLVEISVSFLKFSREKKQYDLCHTSARPNTQKEKGKKKHDYAHVNHKGSIHSRLAIRHSHAKSMVQPSPTMCVSACTVTVSRHYGVLLVTY